MKTKSAKRADKQKFSSLPATDVDAGLQWLASLGEPKFRDSVLAELFRHMRSAGRIQWFQNIHGRLDKGVDYLVLEESSLEKKLLGIQIKGKEITRTGGSGSLSAVQIAAECEAAMKHEFTIEGSKRRLDSVAVWSSAHITPDAEEEFSKSGLAYRIPVKKPRDVFALIDQFAPGLLGNVPELSVVKYIKAQAEPEPEGVRVFGCPLNPKIHFLEPELSEYSPASIESLKTESGHLRPKKGGVALDRILTDDHHTAIFASELSGKSYLLKRCSTLLAEQGKLTVLLNSRELSEIPPSFGKLVSKTLNFYRVMRPTPSLSVSASSSSLMIWIGCHNVCANGCFL